MTTDSNNKNSFNQDFCSHLEFHLTRTFKSSEDIKVSSIWCDGISDLALDKSKKYVNDNRRLQTIAWIGLDGQSEFEMTIYFGPKSLSNYAKDLDLKDCIPSEASMAWVKLDINNRTIELHLI